VGEEASIKRAVEGARTTYTSRLRPRRQRRGVVVPDHDLSEGTTTWYACECTCVTPQVCFACCRCVSRSGWVHGCVDRWPSPLRTSVCARASTHAYPSRHGLAARMCACTVLLCLTHRWPPTAEPIRTMCAQRVPRDGDADSVVSALSPTPHHRTVEAAVRRRRRVPCTQQGCHGAPHVR
jgi:hypothetical protein